MKKIIDTHLTNFDKISKSLKMIYGDEIFLLDGFVTNQNIVQGFF
jgi:hypothetical protein